MRSALAIAALLLLTACQQPGTHGPQGTAEEIAQESAYQDLLIEQAEARGGSPRPWRKKQGTQAQFERVAGHIEEAGADICRAMGLAKNGCYYDFSVSQDHDINAHADGKRIVVTNGMLRFVDSDDELALVIAHEMAHNLMQHTRSKQINSLVGTALGYALDAAAGAYGVGTSGGFSQAGSEIGGLSYSAAFEQEADYVGMYIAARAGYDVKRATGFWRRFTVQEPDTAYGGLTHPSNPERFVAMQKTVQEIAVKRKDRLPLVPEFKKDSDI